MIGGYHSHPTTPQSTVPSPGAASINSIHEEYPDMNSPGWPRTPASPVRSLHFKLHKNLYLLYYDYIYTYTLIHMHACAIGFTRVYIYFLI